MRPLSAPLPRRPLVAAALLRPLKGPPGRGESFIFRPNLHLEFDVDCRLGTQSGLPFSRLPDGGGAALGPGKAPARHSLSCLASVVKDNFWAELFGRPAGTVGLTELSVGNWPAPIRQVAASAAFPVHQAPKSDRLWRPATGGPEVRPVAGRRLVRDPCKRCIAC